MRTPKLSRVRIENNRYSGIPEYRGVKKLGEFWVRIHVEYLLLCAD